MTPQPVVVTSAAGCLPVVVPSGFTMRVRPLPSRPSRLGTRRRIAAKPSIVLAQPGASRSEGALSFNTEKVLQATSVHELDCRQWLHQQTTPADDRFMQTALHRRVLASVHLIWGKWASAPKDDGEAAWWAEYRLQDAPLVGDSVWIARHARLEWLNKKKKPTAAYIEFLKTAGPAELPTEKWNRVTDWLKANKPTGQNAQTIAWEKRFARLRNCQMEWIGYRAACCEGRTASVAVPVGCNDRLCPLCGAHRSQRAQRAIKSMFDRLTHPVLLTLTTPNIPARDDENGIKGLRKHHFTRFRQQVRKFQKQHKEWLRGGVYSLETTYNAEEKSWHIHCHILGDMCSALPSKRDKTILAGESVYSFTALKLKLEFDWTRLWVKGLGKMAAKNASAMVKAGDEFEFAQWVRGTRESAIKVWTAAGWRVNLALSDSDIRHRTEWNRAFRRSVDVRPVMDRAGASREVLKYITKSADFADIPDAIEEFSNATRGARLIQTFGSWYGANFDASFDPEHFESDFGEMKCACGLNCWERIGVFYRSDIVFDASGRSFLRPDLNLSERGTVPRPTIRALEARKELTGDDPCPQRPEVRIRTYQGIVMEVRV